MDLPHNGGNLPKQRYRACRVATRNVVSEALTSIMATSTAVLWQVRLANDPGPRVQPRYHASAQAIQQK
jgi:hypothetical protein